MTYVSLQMQEEPDEDSQCLSDDTDIEISTQVCFLTLNDVDFQFKWMSHAQRLTCVIFALSSHRTRGSAQSVGSITHLCRSTVFAAGLYVKTGTKMSLDLPTPFLSLTSQHAALSPPTMKKMTVTQASMFQTAAGQCLTLSYCPPTLQLIDLCPLCSQRKARGHGPPVSWRTSSCQEERVRRTWAWRSKKWDQRHS